MSPLATRTEVTLVYLGTASYDLPEKRIKQTSWYSDNGAKVISLDVVSHAPSTSHMQSRMDEADVILVSGGNTSFAMRRWKRLGLDVMMREACLGERRVVMAGGSAGAIWKELFVVVDFFFASVCLVDCI